MRCRCGSISRCNSDLSKLSSMISYAESALSKARTVSSKLNTCASHYDSAYRVNNTADAVQATRTVNSPTERYIRAYLADLRAARSEIQDIRADYVDEDDAYHEWVAEQASLNSSSGSSGSSGSSSGSSGGYCCGPGVV